MNLNSGSEEAVTFEQYLALKKESSADNFFLAIAGEWGRKEEEGFTNALFLHVGKDGGAFLPQQPTCFELGVVRMATPHLHCYAASNLALLMDRFPANAAAWRSQVTRRCTACKMNHSWVIALLVVDSLADVSEQELLREAFSFHRDVVAQGGGWHQMLIAIDATEADTRRVVDALALQRVDGSADVVNHEQLEQYKAELDSADDVMFRHIIGNIVGFRQNLRTNHRH